MSAKMEVLDTSLLLNKLSEKVNVTESFLFCERITEPWFVPAEIEIDDGINIWIEKGYKYQLTDVLFSIFISTKYIHVKHLDVRILLNDLSEKTNNRQPSCLTQFIHPTQL